MGNVLVRRLDTALEAQLEEAARLSGEPVSQIIRRAIESQCREILGERLAPRLRDVIGVVKSAGGRATRRLDFASFHPRYLLECHYVDEAEFIMMTNQTNVTKDLFYEIEQTPEEFRPLLLRIVRSFREGVTLPSAEDSFREGWQDVVAGKTHPIDTLWERVEAEH